ncbi:MAG: type I 3-dehydroquinate dehydratase [Acidobacteriota bacterium]
MICVSLGKTSIEEIKKIAGENDIVEVRLDLNDFTSKDIKKIFGSSDNLIVTFRPGKKKDQLRKNDLTAAIISGAAYVDVEIDMDREMRDEIVETARQKGCKVIISYHNFIETPEEKFLGGIVKSAFSIGGDIAKVACMVNSVDDNLLILSLYKNKGNVIALGMGEHGRVTRILGEFFGSPLSYVSLDGKPTAPGQINVESFTKIVKGIKNG